MGCMVGRSLKRLAFVTDAPDFGGAERYIVNMARAAVRREIRSRVIWLPPTIGCDDVFEKLTGTGLDVVRIPFQQAGSIARFVRALTASIADERPDGLVVNATGRPRFWTVPLLARAMGIPSVWVHHMVDGRDPRALPPRRFGGRLEGLHLWRVPQTLRHRLAAAGAAAVIALNTKDRRQLVRWQRVPRERIRVVPSGIDLGQFRFDPTKRRLLRARWARTEGGSDERPIVGTSARLIGGKGIETLISAVGLLRSRGIGCRLVIAGEGPDRAALEARVERLGLGRDVLFAGFLADMSAFYSALDVFALCSNTESFGLVLAEAMACERIVVATPTAGASRQIDHGRTGWQLRGFDPTELADVLRTLLACRERFSAMGEAAREAVSRHFSIDQTLERTLRALRGAPARRPLLRWPGMDVSPYATMTAEDLA